MAKHSLGKHGKGKHAAKAPAGAHASVPERTAEAAAPEEPAAGSQQADDAAPDAGETAALTPPSCDAAAPKADDAPAADAAGDAPAEAPAAEGEEAAAAPAAPSAPVEAPGKHAAPAAGGPAHGAAPAAAAEGGAAEAAHPGKAKKVLLICGGVLLGLLLIAYLAGVFVFSGRFYPNTRAASFDLSLETPEAVQGQLTDALAGYAFEVQGYGLDMIFTADDIAMDLDAAAIANGMRASMNPWLWPLQVWGEHDETRALAATCATEDILEKVAPEVEVLNADATMPVNATIAFDADKGAFEIVPETYGSALDPKAIADEVALGVVTFDSVIALDDESLVQPTVFRDDPRLATACERADTLVTADLDIMLDGQVAGSIDPVLVASWVTLDAELVPSIDDGKLTAWTNDLVARNSTLGAERTYTRADGKVVTVSGGSYGWAFDGDGLAEQVRAAVTQGTKGTIDLPVSQSAARVVTDGNPDWPARYVDVDLSEQYARFYDGAGTIWETPIVSGKPGGWETPTGVWVLNSKASPSKLIGERDPKTGKPEYETTVQYWMPFIGNSIGFHDATWQSSFGGNRWRNGAGSHGCLNISYNAAQSLWGIIGVGDVVVVHY